MCRPQQPAKRATDALVIIDDSDIYVWATHLIDGGSIRVTWSGNYYPLGKVWLITSAFFCGCINNEKFILVLFTGRGNRPRGEGRSGVSLCPRLFKCRRNGFSTFYLNLSAVASWRHCAASALWIPRASIVFVFSGPLGSTLNAN